MSDDPLSQFMRVLEDDTRPIPQFEKTRGGVAADGESVVEDSVPVEFVEEKRMGRSPGRPRGVEDVPEYRPIMGPDGGSRLDSQCHGQRDPHYTIKREKFEHRVIAMLKVAGNTNKEIAEQTGFSPVAISNILRQPWIQDLMRQEQARSCRTVVQEVLEAAALPSVEKLIEVRDKAPSMDVQRKAANDLLDRIYGRPNQPISHTQAVDPSSLTDEEIQAFIQKEVSYAKS